MKPSPAQVLACQGAWEMAISAAASTWSERPLGTHLTTDAGWNIDGGASASAIPGPHGNRIVLHLITRWHRQWPQQTQVFDQRMHRRRPGWRHC